MTDKFRLSVSKTKTFLDCKAKYKFTYIEKLPRKEWSHHILGKFCHRALEWFHQQYINGCLLPYHIIMNDAFKVSWLEFKDKMTPDIKKECWDILNQYLKLATQDKQAGLPFNVIEVEKKFDFVVADNLVLNGAIDRIQIDADNVVHVSDYKTTKNKKYLKNDWLQLLTYAFVLINEDPSLQKIRTSYILLRHNCEYVSRDFSKEEILEIKNKYQEYAKEILVEKQFEPNPTPLCGWCDHLDICPAGKSKMSYNQQNIYGEVAW